MLSFVFGDSPSMQDLERKVEAVATSRLPVLIEGESGTGKQTLAAYIHDIGVSGQEFLNFHCANESGDALATRLRSERLGTLFLKDISLLASPLQQHLLTTLKGPSEAGNGHPIAIRVICSTREPLEHRVARGEFLPDLYFRLAVCRLYLPPLRQRAEDIPMLFQAMVERFVPAGALVATPPPRLSNALSGYPWPGNLRELLNFARTYALAPDPDQIVAELFRRSRTLKLAPEQPEGQLPLKERVRQASRQLEREIILKSLERHHWNRRRTARALQISYRALLYKMKDCDLRSSSESVVNEA